MSKQKLFYSFCKYTLFFGLFYLLSRAQLNNVISPFSFGMFFALVWCNQNILILSPLYIGASYLSAFSLFDLYSALATCFVMIIIYGIHLKLGKRILPQLMILYVLLCQAVSVFLDIYSGVSPVVVFVELVFGLLYTFVLMKLFESVLSIGFVKKFTLTKAICFGVFLLSISCALRSVEIYGFDFAKLFILISAIFSSLILPITEGGFIVTLLSLGTLLYDNNPYLVAPMLLTYIVLSCFRGKHRIFSVLGMLVVECMNVYYFNFYYSTSFVVFLPCLITAVFTMVIPKKYYQKLSEQYNASFASRSLESVINRTQNAIHSRLLKLSQVFYEMDKVFRSMVKGSASEDELKALMLTELKGKLCVDCPEKNRCHKLYGDETEKTLCMLIDKAFTNGRVTLIDIPTTLTGRCFKVNQLVYVINDLISQYKSYATLVGNIDASKVLISEQLYGVSDVLHRLADETKKTVDFDDGMEKKISDELLYNDIVCSDVIVYHKNENVVSCTLEVKKEDTLKSKIPSIVSKITKSKMIVESDQTSPHAGWQILTLKNAPKYDIIFGTSACTKSSSTKSGDTYSLIRIEDGKILMALCDGMGSGEKAQRTSTTAISLVENFYKAGFQSDIILSCVNKFLSLGGEDTFSCLDMSIIDLNNGSVDFVKLGATLGFIKHGDTTTTIECESLPLGIISTLSPTIKSTIVSAGDMIVLATDGVADSFASDEEYTDFVNNTKTLNPQELADAIMDKALENNHGVAVDDMTILVAKLF